MGNKHLKKIYQILSETYPTFEESDDPWSNNGLNATPFKTLTSVALSAMTHDKRVVKACIALYERISTPQELLELNDEELRECIKPVAHYNRKTKNLKKMCSELIERHDGEVPNTREELMKLTGIGRKCTDIMMHFMFDTPSIAVDTHVHRLANRLGIVDTTDREKTADVLNEVTPNLYKIHAHEWLIQHGMKICMAKNPKCIECVISQYCQYFQEKKSS
ncbi:endonuclease III domain-containing protein [Alkalicoccobacillus murimartini]|uniref:Endonuclease-3 n=1 Tax=Alkalicoccobacillus murimartini TaxID=171685 RepID=A0ABT9YL19_9BACI|nr:endonuclease III [Alkalicoccobacillus murimartini]MDQ0208344.1 endonuclease-3 [Alkalicoccobacillus murimartini]